MSLSLELISAATIADANVPKAYATPGTDVHHIVVDQFGIDTARALQRRAYERPFQETEQVFVIATQGITSEAQNALLKLFEEPPQTTRFILIVPRITILLPTLRSRFSASSTAGFVPLETTAAAFVAMPYQERLEVVANKAKEKDIGWMDELVYGLAAHQSVRANHTAQKALAMVERYLHLRGASRKQLLEHLALTIPSST